MDTIIELLKLLNSLSPLAVIALLGLIIYKQVKDKPASEASVEEIKSNHLHEMPEILATLQRIEVKLGEEFAYIKARINGNTKH
jgi:hypothetical protein